ncbi:MAG TPA: PorV/PorQ family protein [Gemmatimonadales bacterium]|nr:PorV/PorQ family protein [Gemmatimonadales bacterium]
MTKINSRVLGTLLALAAPAVAPLAAQTTAPTNVDNTGYGTTTAEFLLLGAGARGTALGNGFAALANDVTALYYNPGGLALMSRPEAMVSSYSYVADTKYSWLGLALPISGGSRAIGVQMGNFGFSNQPVYTLDNPDGDGTTYSVSETFVAATLSQNFSDRFSAGLSLKFVTDQLGQTSASGVALDFGTNFHAMIGDRPIRAAFVIQNLGSNLEASGSALQTLVQREPPLGTVQIPQDGQPARLRASPWTLPVLFRVGLAYDLYAQGMNRLSLLGEFNQPVNTKPGGGMGLEYAMTNIGNSGFSLAARGSYTLVPDNNIDPGAGAGFTTSQSTSSFSSEGVALGGGLAYTRGNFSLGFDYAYKNMGPLGGTNFLSFSLGW